MASAIASPYVKSFTDSRAVTRNQSTAFGTAARTSVTHSDGMMSNGLESHMLPVLSTGNDAYMRGKAYTPFEELEIHEQFGERPDISIYCKECDRHIDLRMLNEHKYYHRALELMKYKPGTKPESVAMLIKRRRGIVRRIKKDTSAEKPLDAAYVQRLNDAYEFLKADLEDTFETYRRICEQTTTDVSGMALNCSPACSIAIGICSSGNERWKSSMEDTRVFQDCFGNDPRKCFFSIYDGHQGRFAAEIAAQELHHALLNCMSKFDPRTKCTCTFNMGEEYNASEHETHSRAQSRFTERGELQEESSQVIHQIIRNCEDKMSEFESTLGTSTPKSRKSKKSKDKEPFAEKMGHAFDKAHKYTDHLLSWGRDENSKVRWSGCSTLACVLQETPVKEENENKEIEEKEKKEKRPPPLKQLGILHLANAGNVHAVLVRGNVPYRLTRDHTPNNPKEKNRVLKSGGNINESEKQTRVNGILTTTRGLGNHGDPDLKKVVITDPYTTSVPIDQYAQFLILASNGVWEVFTEQEAAHLCLQYYELVWVLPQNRVPISKNALSESVLRLNDPQEDDNQSEQMLQNHPDDESSIADAATERRKKKKPRASTARSHVSFADDAEHIDELIVFDRAGNHIHRKTIQSENMPTVNMHPENDANEYDGREEEHNTRQQQQGDGIADRKKGGVEEKDSKKTKKAGNFLEVNTDMRTEVGSRADDEYYSDEFDEEDLGNEADVDTATDLTSLAQGTSLSEQPPSQEQLQRDFARGMAERLVQSALLAGSRDNITVMIVLLPGCGI